MENKEILANWEDVLEEWITDRGAEDVEWFDWYKGQFIEVFDIASSVILADSNLLLLWFVRFERE